MGEQQVIAAGMGRSSPNYKLEGTRSETRLKQVNLLTLPSEYCVKVKYDDVSDVRKNVTRSKEILEHPYGIICVEPNYERVQCTAHGDSGNLLLTRMCDCIGVIRKFYFSGGPVVLKDSGALIAVISMRIYCYESPTFTSHHIYTYIPYYYKWIERKTGLELPKCNGPQMEDVDGDYMGETWN